MQWVRTEEAGICLDNNSFWPQHSSGFSLKLKIKLTCVKRPCPGTNSKISCVCCASFFFMNEKIITPDPRKARMEAKSQGMPTSSVCCSKIQPKVWAMSLHQLYIKDCAMLCRCCLLKYHLIISFPVYRWISQDEDLVHQRKYKLYCWWWAEARGLLRQGEGIWTGTSLLCQIYLRSWHCQVPSWQQNHRAFPNSKIPEHLSGSHPEFKPFEH